MYLKAYFTTLILAALPAALAQGPVSYACCHVKNGLVTDNSGYSKSCCQTSDFFIPNDRLVSQSIKQFPTTLR